MGGGGGELTEKIQNFIFMIFITIARFYFANLQFFYEMLMNPYCWEKCPNNV